MSKGLGQKIAIKFTEDLIGDVSGKPDPIRGLGWTRSEFEKSINTTPRTNGWRFSPKQDIEVTALMIFSDVSTNVTMHLWRVSDQSKLTQITFMSKAGEWAFGELSVPIKLIANTEYVVTSNTPINDGYMHSDTLTIDKRVDFSPHITMIDAYRINNQNTFPTTKLTGPYTNSVGFAYKIERGVGNEGALIIIGEEYQYVNGPLIPKEYKVISVEKHPDYSDDKHLLVTLHPQSRFNNVEGPLTVQYDQSQGSLMGRGGPVEGFTEEFTPTGLVQKPNPGPAENFKMTAAAAVDLLKVEYNNRYAVENFKITAAATITLTFVGVVNP